MKKNKLFEQILEIKRWFFLAQNQTIGNLIGEIQEGGYCLIANGTKCLLNTKEYFKVRVVNVLKATRKAAQFNQVVYSKLWAEQQADKLQEDKQTFLEKVEEAYCQENKNNKTYDEHRFVHCSNKNRIINAIKAMSYNSFPLFLNDEENEDSSFQDHLFENENPDGQNRTFFERRDDNHIIFSVSNTGYDINFSQSPNNLESVEFSFCSPQVCSGNSFSTTPTTKRNGTQVVRVMWYGKEDDTVQGIRKDNAKESEEESVSKTTIENTRDSVENNITDSSTEDNTKKSLAESEEKNPKDNEEFIEEGSPEESVEKSRSNSEKESVDDSGVDSETENSRESTAESEGEKNEQSSTKSSVLYESWLQEGANNVAFNSWELSIPDLSFSSNENGDISKELFSKFALALQGYTNIFEYGDGEDIMNAATVVCEDQEVEALFNVYGMTEAKQRGTAERHEQIIRFIDKIDEAGERIVSQYEEYAQVAQITAKLPQIASDLNFFSKLTTGFDFNDHIPESSWSVTNFISKVAVLAGTFKAYSYLFVNNGLEQYNWLRTSLGGPALQFSDFLKSEKYILDMKFGLAAASFLEYVPYLNYTSPVILPLANIATIAVSSGEQVTFNHIIGESVASWWSQGAQFGTLQGIMSGSSTAVNMLITGKPYLMAKVGLMSIDFALSTAMNNGYLSPDNPIKPALGTVNAAVDLYMSPTALLKAINTLHLVRTGVETLNNLYTWVPKVESDVSGEVNKEHAVYVTNSTPIQYSQYFSTILGDDFGQKVIGDSSIVVETTI
jgi:hypothetical protein